MPIAVGTIISKGELRYRVVAEIGNGASGKVFRADQIAPTQGPSIAIKVPSEQWLDGTHGRQKFQREARILGNIEHRNVVKILDLWTFEDGSMALLQELVQDAVKLRDYLRTATPQQKASVFLQCLYGLRAIHGREGAIHRDVSPNNILVDGTGTVKIIDFGLAREIDRQSEGWTKTGEHIGTPGCIAPEQQEDPANCDHRVDLYAFGRTFAACLLDRRPVYCDFGLLSEPYRTLCARLAEHDAPRRFQSADDAVDASVHTLGSAGIVLDDIFVHHEEFSLALRRAPVGWESIVYAFFMSRGAFTTQDIMFAAWLLGNAIGHPGFDGGRFFDALEGSPGIAALRPNGGAGYAAADPAGDVLLALYPTLDAARRVRCFRALVRIAVDKHRYEVMGDVRSAYTIESDPSIKAQLDVVLDAEDPERVIEGRGVIPQR
jgi:serine/threonine protein kinase